MEKIFGSIRKIGVVVPDLDATMATLAADCGLGPWTCLHVGEDTARDMTYKGEEAPFSADVASTMVGAIKLELAQPGEGRSVFADALAAEGKWLAYMSFDLDVMPFDGVCAKLDAEGVACVQTLTLADGTRVAYYDCREDMGCYVELFECGAGELPVTEGPAAQGTPIFDSTRQVSRLVPDLHAATAVYEEKYGIGPWTYYHFDEANLRGRMWHGQPCSYSMDAATCQWGDCEIEVVQPLEPGNMMQDFLDNHGTVLQHVSFLGDYFHAIEVLDGKGLERAQEGIIWGHLAGYNYFYYYDARDLMGMFLEMFTQV